MKIQAIEGCLDIILGRNYQWNITIYSDVQAAIKEGISYVIDADWLILRNRR